MKSGWLRDQSDEVLDEVEERGVGPWMSSKSEDRRPFLRHPLEEAPPGGEEILLVRRRAAPQTQ